MYINITGSKDNKDVYITQSYRRENGKTSSRIYKKLGSTMIFWLSFPGTKRKWWTGPKRKKLPSAPNYVWTTFAETSYIRLLVYRLLEKKLGEEFACSENLKTLRDMNMILLSKDSGCIPSYKRTKLTDALHSAFGFRTDYEFISKADIRALIKETMQKK